MIVTVETSLGKKLGNNRIIFRFIEHFELWFDLIYMMLIYLQGLAKFSLILSADLIRFIFLYLFVYDRKYDLNSIIIMRKLVVFGGFDYYLYLVLKFLLQITMQPQIKIQQSNHIYDNLSQFQEQYQQNINKDKGQQIDLNLAKVGSKQEKSERQLLRNIGCNKIYNYITSSMMKQKLAYPQQCCKNIDADLKIMGQDNMMKQVNEYTFNDLLGLDCQMILTTNGSQICRIVMTNLNRDVIYDRWFGIKQNSKITDLCTNITGITEQIYQKNIHTRPSYCSTDKQQIQNIIHGKIIVGHDLGKDIQVLGIKHYNFIDTVALLPHNFGLPFKNKLKDLAFQYLKKHMNWGTNDLFQSCSCALQITEKHIKQGRGTIQIQPFPQFNYRTPDTISQIDFQKILKHAELQMDKVLFFVLRGSRSLGIQVQNQFYTSDWDYVLVYDTESEIDGRLIKLPNIDISFFDKNSFQRHLLNNDISYLEVFFVPEKYQFIKKIDFPYLEINIVKLRGTLGFHMNKSNMKIKRFRQEEHIQYKWKILKAQHLQIRFIQLFLQLNQVYSQQSTNKQKDVGHIKDRLQKIIDIKKMNYIWYEIEKQFKQEGNFIQIDRKLAKIQAQKMKQVNAICRHTKGLRYRGQKQLQKRSYHPNPIYPNPIMKEDSKCQLKTDKKINPIHLKLQTVKFLQNHGIQQLQELKIICKRHKFYPNLIQFHYMQSSDFMNPIPRQCRGLIVDQKNLFSIVALPYYKFYDYNDPKYSQLKQIDWNTAEVYEKKDGSIAFMYFYDGKWQVASSTIPDGTNNYCFAKQQTTVEFRKEFWAIFHQLGFKLPHIEDQYKTFIFELMSKNHIIVVKRTHSQLCLHGVRDIRTLQQQDHILYGKKYNWIVSEPLQIPKQQLNIQNLVKRVELLDPLKSEGYVICDKNWRRIKIKNSSYVRINWLGELNLGYNKDPKKFILIEIILSGQADTFCKYCPEWEKIVKQFQMKIQNLNQRVIQVYDNTKYLGKRQLAQQIKKYQKTFQGLVFAIRNNPQRYLGKIETVLNPKKLYAYISSQK